MNIPELINHQVIWEGERGIDNPNHNLLRTQDELDEALEEQNPELKLKEMIDVLIILSGGMGKLCDELGYSYEKVNELLLEKLASNHSKYNLEYFANGSELGILKTRHFWEHKRD